MYIILTPYEYYMVLPALVSRARRIYYVFITLGGARGRENTSGVSRVLSVNIRNSDYGVMLCINYVKSHDVHVTKTFSRCKAYNVGGP